MVVEEEVEQGGWDAAPARAMMAALAEGERCGRGRGRGWYASEETAKQAGRAAEQTMLGLSVHLGKGLRWAIHRGSAFGGRVERSLSALAR